MGLIQNLVSRCPVDIVCHEWSNADPDHHQVILSNGRAYHPGNWVSGNPPGPRIVNKETDMKTSFVSVISWTEDRGKWGKN